MAAFHPPPPPHPLPFLLISPFVSANEGEMRSSGMTLCAKRLTGVIRLIPVLITSFLVSRKRQQKEKKKGNITTDQNRKEKKSNQKKERKKGRKEGRKEERSGLLRASCQDLNNPKQENHSKKADRKKERKKERKKRS